MDGGERGVQMSNASQHPGRSCQLGHHPKLIRGKHCPCSKHGVQTLLQALNPYLDVLLATGATPHLQMCRIDAVIKAGGHLTLGKSTESVTGVPFHMPNQRLKPCRLSEGLSKGHLAASAGSQKPGHSQTRCNNTTWSRPPQPKLLQPCQSTAGTVLRFT